MAELKHFSVLLEESVSALLNDTAGTYIDGTFGRGGHSQKILSGLSPAGRLIAFDKDPQAVAAANTLAVKDTRFTIVHDSFVSLECLLKGQGLMGKVDGILLDLGVSSPQLDDAGRGFSFMQDGPLDMRMNMNEGMTAEQWVHQSKEEDIARVLKVYGEERFSKRMARAICETRKLTPFKTTKQLADVISAANPRWEREKHPATRAFQAIRIEINKELSDLEAVLPMALEALKPGGRIVVISFHSLEDRIVKHFFKEAARGETYPQGLPITEDMLNKRLRITRKPVKAGMQELDKNSRSRSAIMRVAEKIQ